MGYLVLNTRMTLLFSSSKSLATYWKKRLHSLSISAQNTFPILVTILFAISLSI